MVLHEYGGTMQLETRPLPVANSPDETVIRVRAAGICHSDLHVAAGEIAGASRIPLVMGHEIAGEDAELGPVLVYAPWGCGSCRFCAETHEAICPDVAEAGIVNAGGYADHVVVPSRRFLVPIGDLDPAFAAPLGCGGLTPYRAVTHAVPQLARKGARALVIGAGGLGQFGIQYLRLLTDADVVVSDPAVDKRTRALELGAHEAVSPDDLGDDRFDAVLDFVGGQSTLEQAVARAERKGIVVLIGLFGGKVPFSLRDVRFETRLMSSMWGTIDQLREVVAIARRGDLESAYETLPLEQANEGHSRLRAGEVTGRLVLVP